MKRKLGEFLVERGRIDRAQLRDALDLQRRTGLRLGAALIRRRYLSEEDLVAALGEMLQVRVVDLSRHPVDSKAADLVGARFASEHDLFAFASRVERGQRVLTVAMADPLDMRVADELGFMANARIEAVLAMPTQIDQAIRRHYGTRLGAGPRVEGAVRLNSDPGSGTMVIMRRGGGEMEVETSTGDLASRPDRDEREALLLTEEVPLATPLDPDVRTLIPGAGDPSPDLGALIDADGSAVGAETVVRLERRFWALMRVLTRKGIVTREEFLRELEEDESWSS